MSDRTSADLPDAVLAWAAANGRDLPWRHSRDPWAVLVSEIMAQQTQVDRVIPKYHEFLRAFPTAEACAAASLGDVLRIWQGLGYPRRARNLHEAARAIAADRFPDTVEGLRVLPGVGAYTARAVLAFAFECDVAVVDTNAARVLARWAGRRLTARQVQTMADDAVPEGQGWAWNQAMLDVGALLCRPRRPACDRCPAAPACRWRGVGPDPAIGSAGVSSGQARFEGSDRQGRGRLMRRLGDGAIERDAAAMIMAWPGDPDRVARVLNDLMAEGLVMADGETLRLP